MNNININNDTNNTNDINNNINNTNSDKISEMGTMCGEYNTPGGCKLKDNCPNVHSRVCIFYPNCWRGDFCYYPHVSKETEIFKCKYNECPRYTVILGGLCKICELNQYTVLPQSQINVKFCSTCNFPIINGICMVCSHPCRRCGVPTYYDYCQPCYKNIKFCSECNTKKIKSKCPQCDEHKCSNDNCDNRTTKRYCQQCFHSYKNNQNNQNNQNSKTYNEKFNKRKQKRELYLYQYIKPNTLQLNQNYQHNKIHKNVKYRKKHNYNNQNPRIKNNLEKQPLSNIPLNNYHTLYENEFPDLI